MTMTVSTGMLEFQPLVEVVIVIVISHRPEAKKYCSLILNSYLLRKYSFYFVSTSFSVSLPDSDTALMKYTPEFSVLR